jgi:hypothetical protein
MDWALMETEHWVRLTRAVLQNVPDWAQPWHGDIAAATNISRLCCLEEPF